MKVEDLARQAYQAFAEHSDRYKPDECRMPIWEELPSDLQIGWQIVVLRTVDNLFAIAHHELLRDDR